MIFKKYLGRVHRGKKENENYPDIANVLICIVTDFFPMNTFIHVLIFVKIGLYFYYCLITCFFTSQYVVDIFLSITMF